MIDWACVLQIGKDWSWAIELASALGVLVAAIFAWKSARAANRSMLFNVVENIRKDYRSAEMHHAVSTLWRLNGIWGEYFAQRYAEVFEEDQHRIAGLPEQERAAAEADTLHYQRRLVSHFYQYLATLYSEGILPKKILFKTWTEDDLRIIPNIIIPIEMKLREIIKRPQPVDHEGSLPRDLSALLRLYRDSKDC